MTAQQEAARLRKEFGEKAVKVVDEILRYHPKRPYIFDQEKYWKDLRSELQKPKSEDKRMIPTEREHLQYRLDQLTEAMNESIKNGKTIFLDWPIEINEIIMKLKEE